LVEALDGNVAACNYTPMIDWVIVSDANALNRCILGGNLARVPEYR